MDLSVRPIRWHLDHSDPECQVRRRRRTEERSIRSRLRHHGMRSLRSCRRLFREDSQELKDLDLGSKYPTRFVALRDEIRDP